MHIKMFRCPRTGMNVSVRIAPDTSGQSHAYESVACPACAQLHFINKTTGKLLGEDKK